MYAPPLTPTAEEWQQRLEHQRHFSHMTKGVRQAILFVPSDPNRLPPYWQNNFVTFLWAIGKVLGEEASAFEILGVALMPHNALTAWVSSGHLDDETRALLVSSWLQCTPEMRNNLQNYLRESVREFGDEVFRAHAWNSQ